MFKTQVKPRAAGEWFHCKVLNILMCHKSAWKIMLWSNCFLQQHLGRDPFNQNFRRFRSKTQWIGWVQSEKFRKNWSTFWGGPLFPVGPVWILVEWIASLVLVSCEVSRKITRDILRHFHGLYSHWPWLSTNQRARIRSVVVQKSIDTSLWRHTATRLANRTMPSPY